MWKIMFIIDNNSLRMKRIVLMAMALIAFCTQAQIFYKVTSPTGGKVSYVFGTHHLAPLSMLDSIPGVREALDDAETIVGEVDVTGGEMSMAMAMQKYMIAPTDSTLGKLLTPEEFTKAEASFNAITEGAMNFQMLNGLKPMVVQAFAMVTLMQKELGELKPGEQLDSYFQIEGKKFGKTIVGLETVDEQAQKLYCTTPLTEQARDLVEMLSDPAGMMEELKTVNNAYFSHDLDALLALSLQEKSEHGQKFMEAILNQRNAAWLEQLPKLMEEGDVFMAVGAMHLPGEKGVLEGLRKRGFKVEAIN